MEPSKSIRVGTGRWAGKSSGKTVAESGPYRQSQGPGGGRRSFERAGGGRGRRVRAVRLPWGAGVYPEATAELQKVSKVLGQVPSTAWRWPSVFQAMAGEGGVWGWELGEGCLHNH